MSREVTCVLVIQPTVCDDANNRFLVVGLSAGLCTMSGSSRPARGARGACVPASRPARSDRSGVSVFLVGWCVTRAPLPQPPSLFHAYIRQNYYLSPLGTIHHYWSRSFRPTGFDAEFVTDCADVLVRAQHNTDARIYVNDTYNALGVRFTAKKDGMNVPLTVPRRKPGTWKNFATSRERAA